MCRGEKKRKEKRNQVNKAVNFCRLVELNQDTSILHTEKTVLLVSVPCTRNIPFNKQKKKKKKKKKKV